MSLSKIHVSLQEHNDSLQLVVRWYGVERYGDISKTKKTVFHDAITLDVIGELNPPTRTSMREESFLRTIYRDLLTTNAIPRKSTVTLNVSKDETRSAYVDKSNLIESQNRLPSISVYKKVKGISSSTAGYSSFSKSSTKSSDLDYHNLSLIDRNSFVVSSLGGELTNTGVALPNRRINANKKFRKLVPDIANSISAQTLLGFFVKEYHLKQPLSSELELLYKGMYEVVIKKDRTIYKLLKKNINILPEDLIELIINGQKSKALTEASTLKDDSFDRDLYFYTSLARKYNNIMDEISYDLTDLSQFYYPLFLISFDFVKPINSLVNCDDEHALKKYIGELSTEIKMSKDRPGSAARLKVMEVVCAGEINNQLAYLLSYYCGNWLNNLLKSLFSPYSSVREESCVALAYILTRPLLANELMRSRQFDVTYDMVVVLLRAIEQFPENIASFYCVIGYIIQKSTGAEMINYIIEVGPNSNNNFMMKRWPKLVYYALKYWPKYFLLEQPGLLRKLIETFQMNILQKKAKQSAKMALSFLCKKFSMHADSITTWYGLDNYQN